MFERENSSYHPTIMGLNDYINNSLWNNFYLHITDVYHLKPLFEFSKCSYELGWNVKFKKGNKTICTIYPKKDYFTVMIVIGRKEKEYFESSLASFGKKIQDIYKQTKEGNGQRWLMIDLEDHDICYEDVKKILAIRAMNF